MKKLCLLVVFMPLIAVSQKLENLKAVPDGNKIIITYDITEGVTGDTYEVSLFASHNNFSQPVKLVSGDVGRGVVEGRNKRIVWESKLELGDYKGELSFEVKAEVVAALSLRSNIISAKRGKTVPVSWRGGDKNQPLKIELLKSGAVAEVIATVSNEGAYQWNIPSKQPTGKDFQLRLVSGKEIVTTQPFAIRHKVPTALKAAPLLLLGLLAIPSSGSSSSSARTLPPPPTLTLN